jgi:septal ring factor EnvC (AmiA/AmiB activator)
MNDELQMTADEIRRVNEEIRRVNEEIRRVNEEIRKTNDEIRKTNDEARKTLETSQPESHVYSVPISHLPRPCTRTGFSRLFNQGSSSTSTLRSRLATPGV